MGATALHSFVVGSNISTLAIASPEHQPPTILNKKISVKKN
jgi:hypothetical protein